MSKFIKIEEINAWQESVELVKEVYCSIKNNNKFFHDFGLKDQIQRSVISIPSNIAEGYERESKREFIRFLYIPKGHVGN